MNSVLLIHALIQCCPIAFMQAYMFLIYLSNSNLIRSKKQTDQTLHAWYARSLSRCVSIADKLACSNAQHALFKGVGPLRIDTPGLNEGLNSAQVRIFCLTEYN